MAIEHGCGEGAIVVISQIDADRYESLATISTVKGPAPRPSTPMPGRLYLAVPSRAEQESPQVRVYQVRR
jgi:hypothetical protein